MTLVEPMTIRVMVGAAAQGKRRFPASGTATEVTEGMGHVDRSGDRDSETIGARRKKARAALLRRLARGRATP